MEAIQSMIFFGRKLRQAQQNGITNGSKRRAPHLLAGVLDAADGNGLHVADASA